MSAPAVSKGAAYQQAYNLGYAGEALPAGADGGQRGAFELGVDDAANGRPHAGAGDVLRAAGMGRDAAGPEEPPARTSARGRPAGGGQRPSSGRPASRSPRAPSSQARAARQGQATGSRLGKLITHPASLGGDGGGLLLAIFLYPLALAVIQHGPSGVTSWLKAKFLNSQPALPTTETNNPYHQPPSVPGAPGSGTPNRLPNGQQIPGTAPSLPPGATNS
jgi:hypothetical protein